MERRANATIIIEFVVRQTGSHGSLWIVCVCCVGRCKEWTMDTVNRKPISSGAEPEPEREGYSRY